MFTGGTTCFGRVTVTLRQGELLNGGVLEHAGFYHERLRGSLNIPGTGEG